MARPSAAQTKAVAKYIKEHQRSFTFRCHRENDADLIAFLEEKGNVSGYLKELVRDEMRKTYNQL